MTCQLFSLSKSFGLSTWMKNVFELFLTEICKAFPEKDQDGSYQFHRVSGFQKE